MNENFDKETVETFLKDINSIREYYLKKKPHIKKYCNLRKLHSEILKEMEHYSTSGHYFLVDELDKAERAIFDEAGRNYKVLNFNLNLNDYVENQVYVELQAYKNHSKMTSMGEIFASKHKLRRKDKLELLQAMNKSFISFFHIVDFDTYGYVKIVDLFTGKEYQIIDIGLSSHEIAKKCIIYARLIKVDDISFVSTVFVFRDNVRAIKKYIKSVKERKRTNVLMTLETYKLYKTYGFIYEDNKG